MKPQNRLVEVANPSLGFWSGNPKVESQGPRLLSCSSRLAFRLPFPLPQLQFPPSLLVLAPDWVASEGSRKVVFFIASSSFLRRCLSLQTSVRWCKKLPSESELSFQGSDDSLCWSEVLKTLQMACS